MDAIRVRPETSMTADYLGHVEREGPEGTLHPLLYDRNNSRADPVASTLSSDVCALQLSYPGSNCLFL